MRICKQLWASKRQAPSGGCSLPLRGWHQDAAHRHPDLRGQGPAEGGDDGAGGHLRAGLSGLLVRFPAGPIGARRVGAHLAGHEG